MSAAKKTQASEAGIHEAVDRSKWPHGPWDNEPDRAEFKHLGFPCLLVRQSQSGHWCGYVAVPPGHPWHGLEDYAAYRLDVEVHGGITYGNKCAGKVCHVPAPGEPDDVTWLGFDCHHSWDVAPLTAERTDWFGEQGATYKTESYVRRECQRLAEQAFAAAFEAEARP